MLVQLLNAATKSSVFPRGIQAECSMAHYVLPGQILRNNNCPTNHLLMNTAACSGFCSICAISALQQGSKIISKSANEQSSNFVMTFLLLCCINHWKNITISAKSVFPKQQSHQFTPCNVHHNTRLYISLKMRNGALPHAHRRMCSEMYSDKHH